MKRRDFLTLTGAAGAGVLARGVLPGAGRARAAQAAAPPNVVLIISDDQHWGDYGFMGHKVVQTPHIDRLAEQSLVFTRGYVPTSLCRPSLATMVTGLYPHQHRVVGNDPKGGNGNKPGREAMIRGFEKHPSVPKLLAGKGYVSHQSGKWWEGHYSRGGFTHGMTQGSRHGDDGLTIGRKGMKPLLDFVDQAVKDRKPFFVWYAPFLPHTPHNPPRRLLDKYKDKTDSVFIARYWAMCEWFDETVGQLTKFLDDRKLAADTLVLYVCDNGWIQLPKSGGANFARSKRSPYDGGVRTPIMVRWPGKVKPRKDTQTLASSIDLAPTILAACGIEKPKAMPGTDLRKLDMPAERRPVFGAVFEHDVVDLADPTSGLRHRWAVAERWKLIWPNPKRLPAAKPELYDILADPHEKQDLAAKRPEEVTRMKKLIQDWWTVTPEGV